MNGVTDDRGLLARLRAEGYDFFTGVPDRSLARLQRDAADLVDAQHVPATWEAEAVALAAGSALAGARPCVYLPESGVGYALEPLLSLCRPWGVEPLLLVGRAGAAADTSAGTAGCALLDAVGWSAYRVIGAAA